MFQPSLKPIVSGTILTLSIPTLYCHCQKSLNHLNLFNLLFLLSLTSSSSAAPSEPRAVVSDLMASPSDPSFIDSNSAWQRPVFCPDNTFVDGFKSWQDDSYGDSKGLTQIVFSCVAEQRRSQSWITSGVGLGKETQARHCRNRGQYIVGVKVIFGGSSVGAVALMPICDVPNWASTASSTSPSQRHMLVHNIPAFAPMLNPGRTGWDETDELLCGSGAAICGLNTSVDGTEGVADGIWTDESGINEIQLFCCSVGS